MKNKYSLNNIFFYIQGHIRYRLYYSKRFSWLIPNHIREQIDMRIDSMNKQCFLDGSCKECGCMTTHLQMADKACEGNCYPFMLNKNQWIRINNGYTMLIGEQRWLIQNNKFKLIGK